MIVAINYANKKYIKAQKFNSYTAIDKGKVDEVISYSPYNIDLIFKEKNLDILNRKRGNGFWLWKPYFILKTLKQLQENDYLVYLDSGAYYIRDIRYLIQQMDLDKQEIMSFELPFKERMYTKRDVFVCMECDTGKYTQSFQRMATMIIFKKTSNTIRFAEEWLKYGQKENIITDDKNHLGKPNYSGFLENRHDQSIFSLLCKKYNVKAYRDPSQYGRFPDLFWKENVIYSPPHYNYPQIIVEHRQEQVTKKIFWKHLFFAYAPKAIIRFYLVIKR